MSEQERPTPAPGDPGRGPRRTVRRQEGSGFADRTARPSRRRQERAGSAASGAPPSRGARDAEVRKRYFAGGSGLHLHAASRAVVELLDADVAELLQWLGRDLDPSAELDDAVQTLALAQLEAQASASAPTGPALARAVSRRARRQTWQMRQTRGHTHRVPWHLAPLEDLAGPDADPAVTEDLGWDDVVHLLGWQDGLTLWLWAVEGWSLSDLGAWHAVTKQQAWRILQQAVAALRAQLTPRRAG